MGLVAPVRRQLGHPTIFNILGPLLNPARPDYMIVGVHSRYLGLPFAEALKRLGVKRAWVVNGDEGLDEISPEGTSHVSLCTKLKKTKAQANQDVLYRYGH